MVEHDIYGVRAVKTYFGKLFEKLEVSSNQRKGDSVVEVPVVRAPWPVHVSCFSGQLVTNWLPGAAHHNSNVNLWWVA